MALGGLTAQKLGQKRRYNSIIKTNRRKIFDNVICLLFEKLLGFGWTEFFPIDTFLLIDTFFFLVLQC